MINLAAKPYVDFGGKNYVVEFTLHFVDSDEAFTYEENYIQILKRH